MDDYLKDLNLVDLVSERHKYLRRKVMQLWLDKNGEYMTETEAHLLGMLDRENMTMAKSAKKINLSRQATHKCAKKLIDRGYIIMSSIEGNNRDKLISLTEKGVEYCSEMLKLKEQIEEEVARNIGNDNVELFKMYLRKDWLDC